MRVSGFYWVLDADAWVVAEWLQDLEKWFLAGEDRAFGSFYWRDIDERQIVRGE